MKLYATVSSERASKGQGGNRNLDTEIKIGDRNKVKFLLSIQVGTDGKSYRLELVDMRRRDEDKVLALVEGMIDETPGVLDMRKGEKQKGYECHEEHQRGKYAGCTPPHWHE